MKECEEHNFGKWTFINIEYEAQSCMVCGASRVRLTEVVEPINTRPDYAVVIRKDIERLERLCDKKIDRVE